MKTTADLVILYPSVISILIIPDWLLQLVVFFEDADVHSEWKTIKMQVSIKW